MVRAAAWMSSAVAGFTLGSFERARDTVDMSFPVF